MEEIKMKRNHSPRKGFKITIYGVADYQIEDNEQALDFAKVVNEFMKTCLQSLQDELQDKSFRSRSSFTNCEIMGHSNKQYPDQVF